MRDQQQVGAPEVGHRLQIGQRVVPEREHVRDLRQDAAAREEQRVPVGSGIEHRLHCERTAAAGAVVHDDRLPKARRKVRAHQARHDIHRPARRRRDDKGDALLRPGGAGCGGGQQRRYRECKRSAPSFIQMTRRDMARCHFAQARGLLTAARHGVRAARVEVAARRRGERRGDLADDRLELRLARIEARHLLEQRLGIRMVRLAENFLGGADSTTRPRYMMTTRSERCSTTPRSWLMKR